MDLAEMLTAPQDVAAWQLADADLLRLIPELSLRMRQLEALRVRLMHQVDQRCVAEQVGASSPGNWLAGATTMTPGHTNRIVRLGRELAKHPEVASEFDSGKADYDQVRVIVELLAKVPDGESPASPKAAEAENGRAEGGTGDASTAGDGDPGSDAAGGDGDQPGVDSIIFGPHDTRTQACARYLLYAARTEDSTTLARRAKALELILNGDKKNPDSENAELNEFHASPGLGGRVHLKGHLDAASGEALLTALSALSKPHPGTDNRDGQHGKDQRTPAQRRADALTHIIGSYLNSGHAPTEGGERPHINVFVDADDLAATTDNHHQDRHPGRRRGPAWMPWLGPITLDLAAQISCDADITPITMDTDGNPLDVGRTTRLIPRKLRRALSARDCGCAFPGCGRPAAWTEGHHIQHWSNGGPTNLSNLVLLCRFHHTTIHRGDWTVTISKDDGHPWFTPPAWIDPHRQPVPAHNRRNQIPLAA
ncbi:HNH endonuclease signature motif containing protein [Rhodococcus sp. UNC363MFTsu5.1]|uniref:HNH endonuclease signature motif containing protein n=1 Tax=Rhodococcus sp. UNC363MFTsu5.1 TaxID=1449069 RepID=UPI000481CEF3|nr:HNH endonuclease signature motif containing protein [Rhodococcus sp. UNC363MFTsu5.1]